MSKELNVGFIGNPNCGKTTLFNAYTGARLKVANWPGVTVEKKEGAMKYHDHKFKLVDLPGIYSLTSYTMEERLSRQYILEDEVDVIVDIADASCLERNLYLTLQLIELGKPVILALNMMDIVEERGMELDLHRLPEMLGIPCIPVSARKKTGLDILMHTVAHHQAKISDSNLEHHHYAMKGNGHHKHQHHSEYAVVYSDEIEDKIDEIIGLLKEKYSGLKNPRWYAIKLLEMDEEIMEKYPLELSGIVERSYETEIINQKYDFIEEIIEEVLVNKTKKAEKTDRMDALLTHPVLGLPMFLGIMALVFFFTFTVGDFLKGYMELLLDMASAWIGKGLGAVGAGEVFTSLVVDGIVAGVGGILSFLPNIFILFLALAVLEDSGYMARVAYVMDGIMSRIHLSGRAFIPMLLGFGCTVPAIMASRALENPRDRIKTIFVTPFMSCSARLPIYVLFSQMFFGKYAMAAAFSMYVIGLLMAIIIALVLGWLDKGGKQDDMLLIELPEYKTPNGHTIFIYVWEKVKDYLQKAGTTIFVASIVVWGVLNFGPSGMVTDMSESFGAGIGRFLVPLLAPAGLGLWQIGVALISGIAAKEVVVSSMTVLFAGNANSDAGMAELAGILGEYGFGPLNAYALMVFCLLYVPCVAAIATMKRELNSGKLTLAAIFLQLLTAWVTAVLVYQIGGLLW